MGDSSSSSSSSSPSPKKQPHALLLSFPMQGHLNPLMQLARQLASPSCGFIITFVLSHHHHAKHSTKISSHAQQQQQQQEQEQQDNIRLVGVPDKLPPERTGGAEFRDSLDSMLNMRDGVEQLLLHLNQQSTPVTLVLADTFVVWANQLARQFHIPYVAFFTSNAASACIFLHARSLQSKGVLPFRDESDNFIANDPVADVPGIPPIYPRDFPICFTFGPSHYRYQFVLSHYENFRYCSGMLMNSFEELETRALAALREDVPAVYPVGPLLLLCGEEAYRNNINVNYWPEQAECLNWLDTQETASVLYVSFGSIATMPASQIKEMALGLEASGQPFLWVIRPDSVEGSISTNLPQGFLSRTKDQGLIISWAPQLAVLAHPAVGGFMTHCGWNSTMENLSTGGLPTICWPLVAEQRMNCRMFVDEWKVGIEIKKKEPDGLGLVDKDEVERAVRSLMQGEEGRQMRARAANLQETAKNTMEKGGSSIKNLEAFVEACKSNTLKPRN